MKAQAQAWPVDPNAPAPPLDEDTLQCARMEVITLYGRSPDIEDFNSFEQFFGDVDLANDGEVDWKPEFYKPYFKKVWEEIKKEGRVCL